MEEETRSLRRVVESVFRAVWNDYYDWEQSFCTDVLGNLNGQDVHNQDGNELDAVMAQTSNPPPANPLTEDLFSHEYVVFEPNASTSDIKQSERVAVPSHGFAPSDPYEACVPAQRLVLHGDDSNDMPYVPYADDGDFDTNAYIEEYERFAWQSARCTLEVKWICLETSHRLHRDHNLNLSGIDATGIFPQKLLSCVDQTSRPLLQWMKVNDPPSWEPLEGTLKYLSAVVSSCPDVHDWSQRIQGLLGTFCSSLNCVQGYCWSHESEFHDFSRHPRFTSLLSSTDSNTLTSSPCGPDCYLQATASVSVEEVEENFEHEDVHLLSLMFMLSSEAPSCDIASIARKTCREVHQQREVWHRSLDRPASSNLLDVQLDTPSSKVRLPSQMPHFRPCSHEGLCTSETACSCYASSIPCEKTCCCPSDCHIRWQGCRCYNSKKQRKYKVCLWGHQCPCRLAGRECDPEVCDCCGIERKTKFQSCQNAQLQRNQTKRLKVQHSDWGFGVVLCQDAIAHDLVCEYTGQLIYDATWISRDHLAKHRNRFYAHELNTDFSVDASFVGNESRFINHAEGREANCRVQIKLVNGEHRIGIYAKRNLSAGTELFIDYGPEADFNGGTSKS